MMNTAFNIADLIGHESHTPSVGDMLKLVIDAERFWATYLGDGRFEVANILVCGRCTLGDIVQADADGRVTAVVERTHVSHAFSCDSPTAVGRLCQKLSSYGIPSEHQCYGLVMAAFPASSLERPDGHRLELEHEAQVAVDRFLNVEGFQSAEDGWCYLRPLLAQGAPAPEPTPAEYDDCGGAAHAPVPHYRVDCGSFIHLYASVFAEQWKRDLL